MSKYLIVVDMQNDFVYGALRTPEARAIVSNVVKKSLQYDYRHIAFTRDTHGEDYYETQEGKNLPIKHCIADTVGWNLISELEDRHPFALIFDKSSFGTMYLASWLMNHEDDVDEIELCGVCSDICVISNALILKATFPEVPITVDASCCAGSTPERHKAALEVMKSCQINVIGE